MMDSGAMTRVWMLRFALLNSSLSATRHPLAICKIIDGTCTVRYDTTPPLSTKPIEQGKEGMKGRMRKKKRKPPFQNKFPNPNVDMPSSTNKACVHKVTRSWSCPTIQIHPSDGHDRTVRWKKGRKEERHVAQSPHASKTRRINQHIPHSLTHSLTHSFHPSSPSPALSSEE
ncbi:hypothetical protein HOY82DRAFT_555817 [Tuber indicum]|nr:hypothetical protein HOY82DRAFT_555817 [Tuber indicum]